MKTVRMFVCSVGLIAGLAGLAQADDSSADPAAYKQKMHECITQMKTDHPDQNHDTRRKACHKQMGPAPKSSASHTVPATSTPPGTPPSSTTTPTTNP